MPFTLTQEYLLSLKSNKVRRHPDGRRKAGVISRRARQWLEGSGQDLSPSQTDAQFSDSLSLFPNNSVDISKIVLTFLYKGNSIRMVKAVGIIKW